ncbi:MAG: hypothetical protein KatS3mg102_1708 [Planctomycetota bacterium]|nr:MAG: hypothetical protein KatS3mg102_1708 [Planctomycetota bacterium]
MRGTSNGRPARGGAAAVAALAALWGAAAAGCSSTQRISYSVSAICTEPTEPDDRPGIWFHDERESARRPVPIPIDGVVLTLYAVPPPAAQGGEPEAEPVQLGYAERSSPEGIGRLIGEAEIGKHDRLRLQAVKAGYRPESRDFEPAELRLADLAVVLQPAGAPALAGFATPASGPAPSSTLTRAPASPAPAAAGGDPVLTQKRRELLETIERLQELDGRLAAHFPPEQEDRRRLREQIERLEQLVHKLEEAGAARTDGAPAPAPPPPSSESAAPPPAPAAAPPATSGGTGEEQAASPVRALPIEPDAAAFDLAFDRLREAARELGWTIEGVRTREDDTLHPPGWPGLLRSREILVRLADGSRATIWAISAAQHPSEKLRMARSPDDPERAAYVGEARGYQWFILPRAHAEALARALRAK